MPFESQGNTGGVVSPGGFEFGVQGWTYGEARPVTITFFLDGSAMVSDQYGRPIKGALVNGKEVFFAVTPPNEEVDSSSPYHQRYHEVIEGGKVKNKTPLATHAEVIAALEAERVDWLKLTRAGTPQLPYEELVKLPPSALPPVATAPEDQDAYLHQLMKIRDKELRRAALRMRREMYEGVAAEIESMMEE